MERVTPLKELERITAYKHDEEKEALEILHSLKLISIHIINKKWAVVNGVSNKFMSTLPNKDSVHRTINAEIKDNFDLQTITGFKDRKSANEYLKANHPDLTIIPDKNLILDEDTYFKTLLQIDPETDTIVAVYQSMYGFINTNDLSTAAFEMAMEENKLISGYKWQQAMEWDYPVTRPNNVFYDPLNKGNTLQKRKRGDGRAKRTSGVIIVISPDGTEKEYHNRLLASQATGVNTMKIKRISDTDKTANNYKFKLKK